MSVIAPTFNLFCPFQLRWIEEKAALAGAEKSRRIGWTWMHAFKVVMGRIEATDVPNYYHTSTDRTASVEFIDYCSEWANMANAVAKVTDEVEVIDDQKINTLVMTFSNGSKIVAGSSNPKFFRSKGGEVGMDEYDFHADERELFKAAHATAMFWGYPLRFWSTVNGQGTFMDQVCQDIQKGKIKGAYHKVTVLDAVQDGIVERIEMRKRRLDDVPAPDEGLRKEWLADLRATCPDQDTWDQEYMCIRGSDKTSLLSYEMIGAATADDIKLAESVNDLPRDKGEFYAGYDVGRKHDYSVLWVRRRRRTARPGRRGRSGTSALMDARACSLTGRALGRCICGCSREINYPCTRQHIGTYERLRRHRWILETLREYVGEQPDYESGELGHHCLLEHVHPIVQGLHPQRGLLGPGPGPLRNVCGSHGVFQRRNAWDRHGPGRRHDGFRHLLHRGCAYGRVV